MKQMKLANTKLVKEFTKHGGDMIKFLSKNSPAILTGGAIICAGTAVYFAIRGTAPAIDHIHEEKRKHLERLAISSADEEAPEITSEEKEEMIDEVPLKKTEVVQAVWKDYIPCGIALVGVAACAIGAQGINAKRTAAMAALYQMSETALKEYKEKAPSIVGNRKAEQIQDAIMEDKVKRSPFTEEDARDLGPSAPGDVLCFEPITGRYFWASAEKINRAVNELNARMIGGDCISQNEWFYEISDGRLKSTLYGDQCGWNVDHMIKVHFTSSLMGDGTPVLVVGHENDPFRMYQDF